MIHIFLPGGMAQQESFDPKPFAPIEYRGPLGTVKTKLTGEVFSEHHEGDRADRRQDHRHPLDDPRRGRPRTRHPQHVHRVPPEPRDCSSPAWAASSPRSSARAATCRPTSASRRMPNPYAGSGYLSSAYGPFSLGADPANGKLHRPRPRPAQGRRPDRFSRRQNMLATVDNHFRQIEKADALVVDGHVLSAGVQPDQLQGSARSVQPQGRAGRDQGAVRPQRSRHAHADGPPACRRRRAVRLAHLRRLGPSRPHQGRHRAADAAVRQGVRGPDPRPGSAARCSIRRW